MGGKDSPHWWHKRYVCVYPGAECYFRRSLHVKNCRDHLEFRQGLTQKGGPLIRACSVIRSYTVMKVYIKRNIEVGIYFRDWRAHCYPWRGATGLSRAGSDVSEHSHFETCHIGTSMIRLESSCIVYLVILPEYCTPHNLPFMLIWVHDQKKRRVTKLRSSQRTFLPVIFHPSPSWWLVDGSLE